MLSAGRPAHDSPWATVASLIAAGWIGGIGASFLTNALAAGDVGLLDARTSAIGYLALSSFVAATVTALLLPNVLLAIAGRRLAQGRAFAVVFAGAGAGLLVQVALLKLTSNGASAGSGLLWIAPLAVQLFVSYTLLSDTLERTEGPAEVDRAVEEWLEQARSAAEPTTDREAYARALAETRSEVDEVLAGWRLADPALLERLEARADRIAELDPPVEAARPAQAMLVRGLRGLERDLRERRPPAGSEGAGTVAAAFAELRALGLAA